MKTLLKAASISNLTDGRYFAAANAEWMGFVLDPSREDALSIQLAMEFMGWLSGPRYIGEFGISPVHAINEAVSILGLESIEITEPIDLELLDEKIDSLLYRLKISSEGDLKSAAQLMKEQGSYIAQFILDFNAGNYFWNSLSESERELLKQLCSNYSVLLNFSFDEKNAVEIVEKIKPMGIEFRGSEEISTGMQLYTALDPILEALGWEF